MSTESTDRDQSPLDAEPGSRDERVESLLFECLEAEEPSEALAAAVEANPDLAEDLRQAYGELLRWDLVASSQSESPRPTGGPEESLPESLGEYRLLKRIGAGGMGVVFLARDDVLQRTVALKLIRPEHVYMPGARERFQREVETIARLQHPGIVPIYGVGKQEGMPYFTMQHVRGCSVATALADLQAKGQPPDSRSLLNVIALHAATEETVIPDSGSSGSRGLEDLSWPDTCVAIAIQVANALQHAHERGILHRDVKPSNILMTRDGRALLVDFGLAWSDKEEQRLTRSSSELGSLPYLPPEHISGDNPDPNRAADVYSLGVTLYEMLTLHNPFLGRNGEETRRNILGARPLRLRREQRGVSWELETVCLAAMEPDPKKRYRTMLDFMRELERVRDRQSIEARRPGLVRRSTRWAQRHPTMVAAMAVGLISGIIALFLFGVRERQARVESDQLRESAEVERYGALLSNADVEVRASNRPLASRRLLAQCREQDRGWEWRHLEFLTDQSVSMSKQLAAPVQDLIWSPDGSSYIVASQDNVLSCWAPSGEQQWSLAEQSVSALAMRRTSTASDAQHEMISARVDGTLQVRDPATGTVTATFAPPSAGITGQIAAIVASRDGQRVYTASSDGMIAEWNPADRSFVRELGRHDMQAHRLAVNADGSRLASGGFDRTARVFDTATGKQVKSWQLQGWCLDLAWAPDQHTLLVADGQQLQTYDLMQPDKPPRTIERSGVLAVQCSADGKYVAATVGRRVLHVYRVSSTEPFRLDPSARLLGHEGLVQHVRFSPDGASIASGSSAAVVRLWDPRQCAEFGGRLHRRMVTNLAVVEQGIVISSDTTGNVVASSVNGRAVKLAVEGEPPEKPTHSDTVVALLGLSGGAISVDDAGRVMHWQRDDDTWRCSSKVETGLAAVAAVTTSDQHVIIGCENGLVSVREPEPREWQAHAERITAMVSTGDELWTAAVDGSLKQWHAPSGRLIQELSPHPAWIAALLVAPDGKWIATSCADTSIRIFEAATGKLLRELQGHGRVPMAMTTDATGSRLISSGGFDQELRFWESATGRCLLSLRQARAVMAMDFDPATDTLSLGDRIGNLRHLRTRPAGPRAFVSRPPQLDTITSPPGGQRHR